MWVLGCRELEEAGRTYVRRPGTAVGKVQLVPDTVAEAAADDDSRWSDVWVGACRGHGRFRGEGVCGS